MKYKIKSKHKKECAIMNDNSSKNVKKEEIKNVNGFEYLKKKSYATNNIKYNNNNIFKITKGEDNGKEQDDIEKILKRKKKD